MTPIVPFIIGVDGCIGNALWNFFQSRYPKTSGTSRKKTNGLPFLDLSCPDLEAIDLTHATHLIIAAANANIRFCELHPEETAACNVTGPLKLARVCARKGIQTVVFSTDYVFDGKKKEYTEEDVPAPVNHYGAQKAKLEREIAQATDGNYLMLRLTKVITDQRSGLIGEMVEKIVQNQKIYAAKDFAFAPILLGHIVKSLDALMKLKGQGLYNLGGKEVWTRYDFATEVASHFPPSNCIESISMKDLKEPFQRPQGSFKLNSEKIEAFTKIKEPRSVKAILEDILNS